MDQNQQDIKNVKPQPSPDTLIGGSVQQNIALATSQSQLSQYAMNHIYDENMNK